MLSSKVVISSFGMVSRITALTWSVKRAVSSMRNPVRARMCRRICPASTLGKKSRPRTNPIKTEKSHSFTDMLVRAVFVFRAQQVHRQRRNDGSRPHIGSQHRETHRFRERHEQEFRHPR